MTSTTNANQLLRMLVPAVNPVAPPSAPQRVGIEQQSFDEMLSLASTGQVQSGREVSCDCELDPPLSSEQLSRLSAAADQVEAAGAEHALMIVDGRAVVLDLASRTITSELAADGFGVDRTIDAAMVVPGGDDSEQTRMLRPPAAGVISDAFSKTNSTNRA